MNHFDDYRQFYNIVAKQLHLDFLNDAQAELAFKAKQAAIEHYENNGVCFNPNTDDPLYNIAWMVAQTDLTKTKH